MSWRPVIQLSVLVVLLLVFGYLLQFLVYTTMIAVACCMGWIVFSTVQGQQFEQWSLNPYRKETNILSVYASVKQRFNNTLDNQRNRTKKLLSTAQRFKQMFDGLPDACVMLDENCAIRATNQRADELLGLNPADIGTSVSTFLRHPSAQQLLRTNGDSQDEVEIPSPAADNIHVQLRLLKLRDNSLLLIARDVSEVNRILAMRENFIANVSHELRTPLTVLIGYLESLSDQKLDQEAVFEIINRLNTPAQRMKSLVEDLLTLSQLEASPKPDVEMITLVNVPKVIAELVEEIQPMMSTDHLVETHIAQDLKISGVKNELRSAFLNLVTNALRYSPDGGKVTIRWEKLGELARFEVTDEGIGVPSNHIPRITERFYRVEPNISLATGGTGLGLAIVKHVLLRHQSKLAIASRVGRGSTFYCDLPLKPYSIPKELQP